MNIEHLTKAGFVETPRGGSQQGCHQFEKVEKDYKVQVNLSPMADGTTYVAAKAIYQGAIPFSIVLDRPDLNVAGMLQFFRIGYRLLQRD